MVFEALSESSRTEQIFARNLYAAYWNKRLQMPTLPQQRWFQGFSVSRSTGYEISS
jgi:hypothetical protein